MSTVNPVMFIDEGTNNLKLFNCQWNSNHSFRKEQFMHNISERLAHIRVRAKRNPQRYTWYQFIDIYSYPDPVWFKGEIYANTGYINIYCGDRLMIFIARRFSVATNNQKLLNQECNGNISAIQIGKPKNSLRLCVSKPRVRTSLRQTYSKTIKFRLWIIKRNLQ